MDAGQLFEQHHESLLRYLVRLTGDLDVAHDAAQETFARLVAKRPRSVNLRAWLYTVATNVVRTGANRTKRRAQLLTPERAPHGDPSASPEQHAIAADDRRRVRAALDALPERDRVMLLMREEGFSHREIAEATGTTTGSVGTLLARALDRLAELLALDAEP